jgi:hypothetical protein
VFSYQIFASGSIQIKKKYSKCEVTFIEQKSEVAHPFIGSNTLTRHLGSLQGKSVCLVCSILHYLCGIYPDIANTRDDYSLFFCSPTNQLGPRPPYFWVFCITHNDTHTHTHTHTHTPGSRTPLQGWYTTHSTHNRRTSMPLAGFEPVIPAIKSLQTFAWDSAANEIGPLSLLL